MKVKNGGIIRDFIKEVIMAGFLMNYYKNKTIIKRRDL